MTVPDEAAISAQLAVARSQGSWGLDGTIYNRIVQVLLYAVAFLLPLWYLPLTSSVLEFNKQLLIIAVAGVGLVVWLLGVVVSGKLTVRWTPMDKGVLGLVVATVVATVLSVARGVSVFGLSVSSSTSLLSVLSLAVLYFLAVNTLHDHGRSVRNFLTGGALLALVFGLMQMFTWYILPGGFTHSRAFDLVGSLNTLGILAAVCLPLFAKPAAGKARWLVGVGAAGIVLSLVVLAILNWWVLWVVALAGMLAMIAFDSLNVSQLADDYGGKKSRFALSRFVVPMVVIVLGAFLVLVKFNPTTLKQNFPTEISPSSSLSIAVAKGVLHERVVTGFGPENYLLAFNEFGARQLGGTQLASAQFLDGNAEIATAAAQGGVLMLVAFALVLWCLVQLVLRFGGAISESVGRGSPAGWAAQSAGTLAATVALTVGLFVYPFNTVLFGVWFLLLALSALAVSGDRSRTVDIEERPLFSLSASLGFIVGLIVVLSGIYFFSVRYLADVHYARAAAQSDPDSAMTEVVRAINLNGSSDLYYRSASQIAVTLLRNAVASGAPKDNDTAQRIQNLVSSAVQLAQQATQVGPNDAANWDNLGQVYAFLTGQVQNVEQLAQQAYDKASQLRPGDPTYDNEAGQMWLARADLISSLATAANRSQLLPQYQDSLTKAGEDFTRAIDTSANFGLAIYNLGAVYDRQDKVPEATTQLEKLAPYNTNDPTLMFQLGMLYIRGNRHPDAIAAFQRAVLLAPNYADAQWYLALLLEEKGDTDGALTQLRAIQSNNKDNAVLAQKIQQLESGKTSIPPGKVIDNKPIQ